MDTNIACNEIATKCAEIYVKNNIPEYKELGYQKLVEDFTTKYIEAYSQAEKQIKDLPVPKVKIRDKHSLGL